MLQTLLRFVHRLPLCNFKDIYTLYICSVTFLNVNVTTKYISVLTRVHATNLTTAIQECLEHFSNICIFCLYAVPGEHFYIFSFFNINIRRPYFYTPVFRRDVLWYGDVRPSGSPSVRPSQFSALFSYMLWDIELKFCLSLYYDARKIKFECHQFPSIFDGVMPLFNFKLLQICSFPHFSPSCFDISSWNLAYDFVLLYYRTSSSVDIFCQFLLELCPFWNLEYWKYTVFRTFLLHALTYWAEILHLTLFYCTTDQVSVLSISVNFCRIYALLERRILEVQSFPHFPLTRFDILSWNFAYDFVLLYYRSSSSVVNFRQFLWELCPFWNVENWKYTVFPILFLHALTYWAEILHLTFTVLEIKFECRQFPSIFVGVMPL